MKGSQPKEIVLILSGGLGLGAYQAGAFEELLEARSPLWIAGSSVGAVNGALIAGSPPERRIETLRQFWASGDLWFPSTEFPGFWSHTHNWLSAFHTRLFGTAGHFRPRIPNPFGKFRSLYDLSSMEKRLAQMIDFDRLNSQDIRFSVATTDIETGELVIFDTARGDTIKIDHLMASCGFLPEFAPVQIGQRLLGDGGLSANAPIEAVTREATPSKATVFVIDLFARDGAKPESLEDALARKSDIVFANQTVLRLEAYARSGLIGQVMYLSYRPTADEAGPEKTFDLSRSTLTKRWAAGAKDMRLALNLLGSPEPLTIIR